jgi:hypothetical protein
MPVTDFVSDDLSITMKRRQFLKACSILPSITKELSAREVSLPAELLEDKIRGGLIGQVIGDLNGLKHEMKYILEPGDVQAYTPALPDGAWTDDDTDVEWVYLLEMQKAGSMFIPPARISALWKRHINRRIWCSHLYLRQIMDLGIDPPLTGRVEVNPWADFNLSGQFVSESWGLISPGMPRTAARIGVYYTHVSVDCEAVQSTQMMDAMISTAFVTGNLETILDAGAAALDHRSVMYQIMLDVRRWHRENPDDWRITRRLTKEKYCKYGGNDMRDRNGVWLNGASTISALLYGNGDFVETVRHAFNFGWDADNNAAGSGAIIGVIKGGRWLQAQGWDIKDKFRNTSRDDMPDDETLTGFGDRLIALARRLVVQQGGALRNRNGKEFYVIQTETPVNVEQLPDSRAQYLSLRSKQARAIEQAVVKPGDAREGARAAYLAICFDLAAALKQKYPRQWAAAITDLSGYRNVLQVMFYEAPFPSGDRIRKNALAAGLNKPEHPIKLWT